MTIYAAVRESLGLLTKRDGRLLVVAVVIQMLSSLLDLVGVLLLGLVGALAITTVQSQPPPAIVEQVATTIGLDGLSDQALVGVLAGVAALALIVKTAFSAILTRRVFIFLANRQALVSAELASKLLAQPLTYQHSRSSQEASYALIQGAGAATLAVLGQTVILATEGAVLVVLGVALLFVDPLVTVIAVGVFALVAVVLQRLAGGWASRLGKEGARTDIASLNAIQDALATYREITVLHRRAYFVERFQALRWQAARLTADRTFLLQVPKYVFEVAMVVGGGLVAIVLFLTQDSVTAAGILALFLAASSRVMPSLLRMQSASLTLRDNAAAARQTYDLARELAEQPASRDSQKSTLDTTADVRTCGVGVVLNSVGFRYSGSETNAVSDITLEVQPGTSLALVGRSGAGKSTLADIILGVLTPSSGTVLLDGLAPSDLIALEPGVVGYVPQDVALVRGSVRENVALGLSPESVSDDQVWQALERAHIEDVFKRPDRGLKSQIGERGVRLSGGQRQRLGLARALLSEPRLIVLDEATSALDAETESLITSTISALHGEVTLIIVAHRLSTVRDVDSMAYLEGGYVQRVGTFEELLEGIPSLARQASLMGLR